MDQNEISQRVLTMQIIAGALMMGVVMFAAVAAFITLEKEPGDPFMAYAAAGFAFLAFVMQAFVPAAAASAAIGQLQQKPVVEDTPRRTDELMGVFQTKIIIGLAILEGAAFFNLVAYMFSVHWWSLAVAGVLLMAMAMCFPTRFKVENWIEAKQYELNLGQ